MAGKCRLVRRCFNSTLVQLKAVVPTPASSVSPGFNSTLVQLKVSAAGYVIQSNASFNSTLVQLKGAILSNMDFTDNSFNSTLVQLKDNFSGRDLTDEEWFQFYLSSIKRAKTFRRRAGIS